MDGIAERMLADARVLLEEGLITLHDFAVMQRGERQHGRSRSPRPRAKSDRGRKKELSDAGYVVGSASSLRQNCLIDSLCKCLVHAGVLCRDVTEEERRVACDACRAFLCMGQQPPRRQDGRIDCEAALEHFRHADLILDFLQGHFFMLVVPSSSRRGFVLHIFSRFDSDSIPPESLRLGGDVEGTLPVPLYLYNCTRDGTTGEHYESAWRRVGGNAMQLPPATCPAIALLGA